MSISFWIIHYPVSKLSDCGQNVCAHCESVERRRGAQLQTVDGPGQTSVSTSLQTLKLVDLCRACLVSNDRLLLINGLEPILWRWVQHKPHALNMNIPYSAARAGETKRWRDRDGDREKAVTCICNTNLLQSLQTQKHAPAVQHCFRRPWLQK